MKRGRAGGRSLHGEVTNGIVESHRTPARCGQTDTTENITFPQFHWRAVISDICGLLRTYWSPHETICDARHGYCSLKVSVETPFCSPHIRGRCKRREGCW